MNSISDVAFASHGNALARDLSLESVQRARQRCRCLGCAQEDAFVSAKESLALNQEGYKAGRADLTRLLDCQRLLDQAEDGVTCAERAWRHGC